MLDESFASLFLKKKTATLCSIKSFCAAFFKKLPPIKGRGAPCRPPQRAKYPNRPKAPERGIFKPQGGLKRGKPQVGFPLSYVKYLFYCSPLRQPSYSASLRGKFALQTLRLPPLPKGEAYGSHILPQSLRASSLPEGALR